MCACICLHVSDLDAQMRDVDVQTHWLHIHKTTCAYSNVVYILGRCLGYALFTKGFLQQKYDHRPVFPGIHSWLILLIGRALWR